MTPEDAVLSAADAALDAGDIVTDPDILRSYSADRSLGTEFGEPFAAVFPRNAQQVSAVITAAHEHRVPVVPRGAGSGLTGGSNAIDGSLIVCLERMRSVHEVDVANGYVETEPGIDVGGLAAKYGSQFGIDAEYGSATYQPMGDGFEYEVSITQDALIARPSEATKSKIQDGAYPGFRPIGGSGG